MKRKLVTIFCSVIIFNAFGQVVTNGLIGHWSFNGNPNDESINQHHGQIYGDLLSVEGRFGNADQAYEFNNSDHISIPFSPAFKLTNNFSIAAWVKVVSGSGGLRMILNYGKGGGDDGYGLRLNGSKGDFFALNENLFEAGQVLSQDISTDEWFFLVGVKSGDEIRIYINGNKTTKESVGNVVQDGDFELFIGSRCRSLTQFFEGAIDEVSLYNRVLSDTEIEQMYSYVPPEPVLCELVYCDGVNIGIGTGDTHGYKLAVAGPTITTEVKVSLVENWPDYVFAGDYYLPTLEEVERFVIKNQHLPEIPTQTEVAEQGVNIGEMNAKLLLKIEELTLYLIEQNKQSKEQQDRIEKLEKLNSEL